MSNSSLQNKNVFNTTYKTNTSTPSPVTLTVANQTIKSPLGDIELTLSSSSAKLLILSKISIGLAGGASQCSTLYVNGSNIANLTSPGSRTVALTGSTINSGLLADHSNYYLYSPASTTPLSISLYHTGGTATTHYWRGYNANTNYGKSEYIVLLEV